MNKSVSDLIGEIEQDICTCIICYDLFNETDNIPILLTCGHTLCRSCLRQLYARNFKCPLCNELLPLQASEKKNFTITSLLPLIHNKTTTKRHGEVKWNKGERKRVNSKSKRRAMMHKTVVIICCVVVLLLIAYICITSWMSAIYINSNPTNLFSTCSGDFDVFSAEKEAIVSTHPSYGSIRKTCSKSRRLISKYSGIVANQSHEFDSMMFEFSIEVGLYEIPHRMETFCEFGFIELTQDCTGKETIGWHIFKEHGVNCLQIQSLNTSGKAMVFASPEKYNTRLISNFRIHLMEEERKIVLFRKTMQGWDLIDFVTYTSENLMWPVFAIYRTRTAMVKMSLSPRKYLSFDSSTKDTNVYVANDNKTISHYKLSAYTTLLSQTLNCTDTCYIPFSIWFEDMYDLPFQEPLLEIQIHGCTEDSDSFRDHKNDTFILTLTRCIDYDWLGYYVAVYCFQYIDQDENVGRVEAHRSHWNQLSVFVDRYTETVSIYSKHLKFITKRNMDKKSEMCIQVNVNISMNIYAQIKSESGNLRIDHRISYKLFSLCSIVVYAFACIVYVIVVIPCSYLKYIISVVLDKFI